jgi:hypothetical protein
MEQNQVSQQGNLIMSNDNLSTVAVIPVHPVPVQVSITDIEHNLASLSICPHDRTQVDVSVGGRYMGAIMISARPHGEVAAENLARFTVQALEHYATWLAKNGG